MNYKLNITKLVEKNASEIENERHNMGYNAQPFKYKEEQVLNVELTEEQWNRVRSAVLKEV